MKKLVNFRKKYNLTQKEVSNKLGVSQSTVSSWELNKSTPNREFNSNIDRMIRQYKKENEEQEMNNAVIKVDGNTIEVISEQLNLSDIHNKTEWTSIELVDVINHFRAIDGKKNNLLHKNLMAVIQDEFSEEINGLNFQPVSYQDKKGEFRSMYKLTSSQAKQVLVRESKAVRRAVIQMLEYLENEHNTNIVSVVLDRQEAHKLENSFINDTVNKMAQLFIQMDNLHEKKALLMRMANIIDGSQSNLLIKNSDFY